MGGQGQLRAGPRRSDPHLPASRVLGLPGKHPSLRAPPGPARRDRPRDAENKRRNHKERQKKSLNKQKKEWEASD